MLADRLRSGCRRRAQHDPVRDLAGGDQPPQRDQQLAGQRRNPSATIPAPQSQRRNPSATIIVWRAAAGAAARAAAVRARYPCAHALAFRNIRPSGTSGSARPAAACRDARGHCRPWPGPSRAGGRRFPQAIRSGRPRVRAARRRPAVAPLAGQHLLNKHASLSAVSIPTPITRAGRRIMGWQGRSGSVRRRSRRAASIAAIRSPAKQSRVRSRFGSASVLGGSGIPAAVRNSASRSAALRTAGLKPRIPSRTGVPLIRLPRRVRSPTRLSRSRPGRLASSSAKLGIAAMLRCPRSPRRQPGNPRCSSAASKRPVPGLPHGSPPWAEGARGRLRAAMLASHRDAGGRDHMRFNAAGSQPCALPAGLTRGAPAKTVAARFESNRDAALNPLSEQIPHLVVVAVLRRLLATR